MVTMEITDAAKSLEALSNETRLKIYRYLVRAGKGGSAVGDIQKKLEIPGSTLSHHIAKLVRANLVVQERESTVLRCRTNYESMNALLTFLMDCCCEGND